MKISLIDYGMGNLGSVRRSLEECGARVETAVSPEQLSGADGLVLPGVGSFREGVERLRSLGFAEAIRKAALEEEVPLLGICLGMQLLAEQGEEGGTTEGLGLIPGRVRRLETSSPTERIPHVGWNEVQWTKTSPFSQDVPFGTDFYFVHSYHFVPAEPSAILAKTPYCGDFVSVVSQGTIYGTQFHPEKSSKGGFKLLKNFLGVCAKRGARC